MARSLQPPVAFHMLGVRAVRPRGNARKRKAEVFTCNDVRGSSAAAAQVTVHGYIVYGFLDTAVLLMEIIME